MRIVVADKEFAKTLDNYSSQKELLKRKLIDFVRFKSTSPYNGRGPDGSKFGSSDYLLGAEGKFRDIPGIAHAHLTFNISIVYHIEGDVLRLYGIYSHDDMGTGMPPNANRQQQKVDMWKRINFVGLDPTLLEPQERSSDDAKKVVKKQSTAKLQSPMQKSPPVKTIGDLIASTVQALDDAYRSRNFAAQWRTTETKQDALELINSETNALMRIQEIAKQQRRPLHANQIQYIRLLKKLYSIVSSGN